MSKATVERGKLSEDLAKQRQYWDSQVHDLDSIYSRRKGRFGNWIDTTFRWDMYKRYEYTMAHSEPIAGRAFLEVGCGTGRYALEYAKRGARRVVGIDIAAKMIEVCQARARQEGVEDKCSFVVADLLEYRPDKKFDVTIGIGLFDYISDPLPVLKKMRQVTRDKVIVTLPRLWTWRAPVRRVRLALRGCDVYFYSKARMAALIRQAGFKSFEYEQVGQLYCVRMKAEG